MTTTELQIILDQIQPFTHDDPWTGMKAKEIEVGPYLIFFEYEVTHEPVRTFSAIDQGRVVKETEYETWIDIEYITFTDQNGDDVEISDEQYLLMKSELESKIIT